MLQVPTHAKRPSRTTPLVAAVVLNRATATLLPSAHASALPLNFASFTVCTESADADMLPVQRAIFPGLLVEPLRLKRPMLLPALASPWLNPSLLSSSKGPESVLLSLPLLGDIFENATPRLARGVQTSERGSALHDPLGDRKPTRQRDLGVVNGVETYVSAKSWRECGAGGMKTSERRMLPRDACRGAPTLDVDVPLESLRYEVFALFAAATRALAARRGLLRQGKSCLFCAASLAARPCRGARVGMASFVLPAGREQCRKGSTAFAKATAPMQVRVTLWPALPLVHLGLQHEELLDCLLLWELETTLDIPLCGAVARGRAVCGTQASVLPIACT